MKQMKTKKQSKVLAFMLAFCMMLTMSISGFGALQVSAAEGDNTVSFYIGGVQLASYNTPISEGVVAYYQNDGTKSTTEPDSWNAKLEYNAVTGYTLTLNNLVAGQDMSTSSIAHRSCIYMGETQLPLNIVLNGTNTLTANGDYGRGIYTAMSSVSISGTGSLTMSGSMYGIQASELSITGGEFEFSSPSASCPESMTVSSIVGFSVKVGDNAASAITWDGTTHWSNYKYVSVSEAEEPTLPDTHNVYVGSVGMGDGSVTSYYVNGASKATVTEPAEWNAKLEYDSSNGFVLTLNNLQASSGTNDFTQKTKSGIYMDSSNEPLTIVLNGTSTLNTDEYGYGIYANTGNLTILGTGSLHINSKGYTGIYIWSNNGQNLSITSGEISFSGSRYSCGDSLAVSVYENALVKVGMNAATATEWNGTTHWSKYKYVSVSKPPEAKWGSSASELTNSGTLEEALSSNTAYIQLQEDATLTSAVKIASGETLTFDLNGKSLTAESGIDSFSNSGTLNILSSSTEKGIIKNNNSGNCGIYNKGTLTMEDVSVTGGNPLNNNSGTAVIENCSFLNEGGSFYRCAIRNNTDCNLELLNCSLIGQDYGLDNYGTVKIKNTADVFGADYDIRTVSGTFDISSVTNISTEWSLYLSYGIDIKLPSGYSLYNSDGLIVENLDEIENGEYNVRVSDTAVLSYDADTKTATVVVAETGTYSLIFADYGEGNRLQNVDIVEFDFKAGVNTVPQDVTTFILETGDKIMLWYDMTNLVPLCDAYIIE